MNTHISDINLEKIKQILLEERQRLHQSEFPTVQDIDDDKIDIKVEQPSNDDEQLNVVELETEIALQDHILESIAQIDFAIARIEKGQYGSCIDCNKPIPIERLNAFPPALRCVACKEDFEHSSMN